MHYYYYYYYYCCCNIIVGYANFLIALSAVCALFIS
jgi:hypothetical protein